MKKTKILVFDSFSKYELVKGFLSSMSSVSLVYSHNVEDAFEKIKKSEPDFLFLGGDAGDDSLMAVSLYYRLQEAKLNGKIRTIIITWNADEAEILKRIDPKLPYVPLSESLGEIMKAKVRNLRLYKGRKNPYNGAKSNG
jgi:hypothetical protein